MRGRGLAGGRWERACWHSLSHECGVVGQRAFGLGWRGCFDRLSTNGVGPLAATSNHVRRREMLDLVQDAVDGVPVGFWGFIFPPAIWAQAVWASPYLKTYRHRSSGFISLLAGLLMAIAVGIKHEYFLMPFTLGCLAMLAMLVVMLWPIAATQQPPRDSKRRKRRR